MQENKCGDTMLESPEITRNGRTVKNVIQRCGCDKILPLALVYVAYIILHGHLSPGGGFQGGILMVAVVLLVYLGHGREESERLFLPEAMHHAEGAALIFYILVAMVGVLGGSVVCANILGLGGIGDLYSSGTIFWMGQAVAFDVMTASIVLALGMLGVLFVSDAHGGK